MKKINIFALTITIILAFVLTSCGPVSTETVAEAPNTEDSEAVSEVSEETEENAATDTEKTVFQQMREESLAGMVGFEAPADPEMRIGVLMITMANPFWVTFADGVQSMGDELGVQIDIQSAPTEGDISSQLATCESMVSADYDVLVLYAITENNLIPCITKATKAGIPVIEPNIISDIEAVKADGGEVTQITTLDFFDQGVLGAQYIVDQLGDEGGKVAIIEGLAAAPQSMARRDGAKSVFENTDNVTLVTSQAGDWDRTVALNAATNIIQANPDIRGFYCANDVMALAVVEAVIAAGKQDQIYVVGTDFIEDAKTSIGDGLLSGSVSFSPYVWGELSVQMAVMAAEGKEIPSTVPVKNVLVTIDNVNMMEDWR